MKTRSPEWVSQRAAADHLGLSERTLLRWRTAGLLKPGVHFRRKFPNPKSAVQYHLERCDQVITELTARDHRTLELAEQSA